MTISAYTTSAAVARADDEGGVFSKTVGLTIASLFPAGFWAALLAAYDILYDAPYTHASVALVAVAIAMFLAAVCGPLMMRD